MLLSFSQTGQNTSLYCVCLCTDTGVGGGGDELRNDASAARSRIAYAALLGGFLRALKGPHLKRVNHGDTLLTAQEQKERELEDVAFLCAVRKTMQVRLKGPGTTAAISFRCAVAGQDL